MTRIIYITLRSLYAIFPLKKWLCLFIKWTGVEFPKKVRRELSFKGNFITSIEGTKVKLINYRFKKHIPENDIFWLGEKAWEPTTLKLLAHYAPLSETIFDIGANSGILTVLLAKLNPKAQVYAFEPIKRSFDKMLSNIKINDLSNIKAFDVALSDTNGSAKIYDMGDEIPLNATLNNDYHKDQEGRSSYDIVTKRFDSFAMEHNISTIDLIKMDVETYEYYVLKGMGNLLTSPKVIILEIYGEEQWNLVAPILLEIFDIYYIEENAGELIKTTKFVSRDDYNFLLINKKNSDLLNAITDKIKIVNSLI